MEIVLAKPTDLIEILYLLRVCILDMNTKGLKLWNNVFPGTEMIQSDLDNGSIYLVKDKGVCKGMVTLNENEPEDYKQLNFQSGKQKPLYLQNMIVHPKWQGIGIAKLMIEYAQKLAKEKGFDCIRLDVFKPCDSARQLYEKQHFNEVASYHAAFQNIPFICYEKQL
jgi:ribosomal protein S18 acetylase RimI-like enzyme